MKRSYPNLSRLALALAVGTGLAACSVGPDYQRPQSPPPRVASEHLGEFSGERREAPWWSFFDDPQLVRLVDQALARNHDIREARANLRSARALFDDRWLDQLPQVTSQAGYSRSIEQQLDYDGEPRRRLAESYRAGFDAQWEIDLFGRLGRLSDAALARAEAADADLRLVRLSIAADTARAYFEIQGYQRRLDVARAQVRSWRDTLELTRSSLQLGSGLPEDVENAQANLLRSEAAIPPLTTALESARYRLDVLRGEAPGSGAPILDGGAAAPLAKNLPLGDVDRLILQRPDVVSAERQLAASTEDVGAATAELYPRLDLGGFIGFFALRSGDLGSASRAFELAPSVIGRRSAWATCGPACAPSRRSPTPRWRATSAPCCWPRRTSATRSTNWPNTSVGWSPCSSPRPMARTPWRSPTNATAPAPAATWRCWRTSARCTRSARNWRRRRPPRSSTSSRSTRRSAGAAATWRRAPANWPPANRRGQPLKVPIQALAATIMRVSIGRSTIRSTAKPPRPSRSTTSSVVR